MDKIDYIPEKKLNLNKICIACLSETDKMTSIYDSCLNEMLVEFAFINLTKGDGFPEQMCVQCVLLCSKSYRFKKMCQKSFGILVNYFKNHSKEDDSLNKQNDNIIKTNTSLNKKNKNKLTINNVKFNQQNFKQTNLKVSPNSIQKPIEGVDKIILKSDISNDSETKHMLDSGGTSNQNEKKVFDKLHFCKICSLNFSSKIDLKLHLLKTHPKKCNECDKIFETSKQLSRHKKSHLLNKPYKCLECNMSFTESSGLQRHNFRHTGELRNSIGKPHLCSICGKEFKWRTSLFKHIKYHSGHGLFKCKICNKTYNEKQNYNFHMATHSGERPYKCKQCDKMFIQKSSLDKHERVHSAEKPYLCVICGKGYSQSGSVTIHMRSHTGEKPYECKTCKKAFKSTNTLQVHNRIHSGERPYACEICQKRFYRNDSLTIHSRSHHGLRPFKCKVCYRDFGSSIQLQKHLKTHDSDKNYLCTICDKRYNTIGCLRVHTRTHGKKEVTQLKNIETSILENKVVNIQQSCGYCCKAFETSLELYNHLNEDHSEHTIKENRPILESVSVLEILEPPTATARKLEIFLPVLAANNVNLDSDHNLELELRESETILIE